VTYNLDLIVLRDEWNRRARRAFLDAETEEDLMGRRLIEHGAMCYFNCAMEITEALRKEHDQ